MTDPVDLDAFLRMLRSAAEQVKENNALLSRLDSAGGDGDHGTTMMRAMMQLEKAAEGRPEKGIGGLLQDIGWAIMGVDGGATGPLFGSLFLAMAGAAGEGAVLDASGLSALFDAGLAGVEKRTRARVGDKTLMDALTPAVHALREAAEAGADVTEALDRARSAAEEGARSTKTLKARYGRAKNLGEKSIGTEDPGAVSVSLLFKGFHAGLSRKD